MPGLSSRQGAQWRYYLQFLTGAVTIVLFSGKCAAYSRERESLSHLLAWLIGIAVLERSNLHQVGSQWYQLSIQRSVH